MWLGVLRFIAKVHDVATVRTGKGSATAFVVKMGGGVEAFFEWIL